MQRFGQPAYCFFIHRNSLFGAGRLDKAGAPALSGVSIQGKLGNKQYLSANIPNVKVKLSIGILKYAKAYKLIAYVIKVFPLIDILNRDSKIKFSLSPVYVAIVAFCFSMTVGVMWEFFEYGMDMFFGTDMQKDTVIESIKSVALDPTNSNKVIVIDGIKMTMVNGELLPINGYLDIGLIDTMKDLFVNFIGAVVFSIGGFFYLKFRGKKNRMMEGFIPIPVNDEKTEE